MEREAFTILKKIERSWWYFGRMEAIKQALRATHFHAGVRVLDIGTGFGGMFRLLSRYGTVDGIEPDKEARVESSTKGYSNFFESDIEVLNRGMQYDLIGAFDVIEHTRDDFAFLSNLYKATQPGGVIIGTVPAFQWLWSEHDVSHHHYRRYTITSIKKVFVDVGYEVIYTRYWNVLLFPFVLLLRLFGKSGESGLYPHKAISMVLRIILWLEARVVRFLPIPFGLSIVVVGRKR